MITRFYFSMSDNDIQSKHPYNAKTLNQTFKSWFTSWKYQFPNNFSFKPEVDSLFQDYIWPRFYNQAFFYFDVEHDPWIEPEEPKFVDYVAASSDKLGCIYAWLIESQERYGKLIELYQAEENKWLEKLGSESTTLFNDTPQSGGSVTTSDYVTNATTVNTTADVGTPMARVKEVRDNLESLYNSWANEFRKFIIM